MTLYKHSRILIPGLLVIVAMLLSAPAVADIYSYTDENGIRHFTDQPPDTDLPVRKTYMEVDPEPRVTLRRLGTKTEPVYHVYNMFRGPVEIELSFSEAVNVSTNPPLPARFVIPANSEVPVVTLGATDPRQGYSFRLEMTQVPGRPLPVPDKNLVLYPPFPSGQTFYISQGIEGKHTHNDAQSEFAVDITMPIGTPVLAAESGIVMDIEEDFNSGGTDRAEYVMKANHVRLLHDDGSMSNYGHLDYNSVVVGLGQRVAAGAIIGRSGNTGFSTGPHLHFSVQRNLGMTLQGMPFEFRTQSGKLVLPISGQTISGTLAHR